MRELKEKLLQAEEKKNRESRLAEQKKEKTGLFASGTSLAEAKPAAAFSLEEAQNPTESLAEICKYLGLGK